MGNKKQSYSYSFGTFGFCCLNCGISGADRCTGRHIGYEPSRYLSIVQGTPYEDISSGTADGLTRVMVLHPIACGVAFIAFLLSIGGGIVGSLAGAIAAAVALLLTLIVMATDFTVFGILKNHVNDDRSASTAHFGDAIWLLVSSFILLFLGMCIVFFTCCASRREKNRKQAKNREIASTPVEKPKGGKKKKRFGIF